MRADARRACLSVAVLIFSSILFTRPTEAGTISIDTFFQGVPVGFHLEDGFGPGMDFHAFATIGSVTMSNARGVDGVDFTTAFEAYCVDILGSIFDVGPTADPPATVTAVGDLMTNWSDPGGLTGAPGGGAASSLYKQYNPLIQGEASSAAFSFGTVNTTANVARTALAMAIWNVLYDGDASVSFGVGNFYLWCDTTNPAFNTTTGCSNLTQIGSTVALANAFLAGAGSSEATWIQLTNPNGTDLQDFVGATQTAQPVPEPSSLALLGVGTAAAAVARRRGRRPA